jgi:hypothetical protein
MKKIILVVALGIAFSASAQTQVAAPVVPTIPDTVMVSPNASAALASQSTNRVFIDQSGINPDVNITQDGSGNRVGNVNSPMYLRGADQTVVTIQQGTNNQIDLSVVNPNVGESVGAAVTIQQLGNGNSVNAACGLGTASDGITNLSGCADASLNWKFNGNSNSLQFRGTGDTLRSSIDVAGNGNAFIIDALGNKHSQTIAVSGNDNTFNLKQNSTGANGSSVLIDQNGTGASYTIQQSGNIDNVVNIKSVASGGSFNILQKN